MTFTLTVEQQAWIEARVARGEYASIQQGAQSLLDAAIFDRDLLDDDLAWAKPLVDEALAEVERGEVTAFEEIEAEMLSVLSPASAEPGSRGVMTLEEHRRRNKVRLARFQE